MRDSPPFVNAVDGGGRNPAAPGRGWRGAVPPLTPLEIVAVAAGGNAHADVDRPVGSRRERRSGRVFLRRAWRPVARLGSEHGAGDREQAVRDGPQGAGMAVAVGAKSGVLGLADGVALDRDPRPVVDCIAKAGMGGFTIQHGTRY